jgi:sigma-B regulation protein RsbU (phosphoserine phosphatase)
MFHQARQDSEHHVKHEWVIEQLKKIEGVDRVNLVLEHQLADSRVHSGKSPHMKRSGQKGMSSGKMRMKGFHGRHIAEITTPILDTSGKKKTVSLISELLDDNGQIVGRLEVVLKFDYLIENIVASGWWESNKAFLVDDAGRILVSTLAENRKRLADNNDSLEQRTLYGIMSMSYGTFLGKGQIPTEVSGFYKLREAPWSLVMIAPGKEILASIVSFRLFYFIMGACFILLILLLIRFVTGRTVFSIKEVSQAAKRIAQGDFGEILPVKSQDEVGELTRSFNAMTQQLEERMRLKEALDLAMEVQQNLLPQKFVTVDFLRFKEFGNGRIGIAVGDVVGHGIAAALLMTTARALLRCRVSQPGSLSQMINDVNRILYLDTSESGSFMTLFFMLIDPHRRELQWVRAGHDPAIIYNASADSFDELKGKGTAIGVDDQWSFQDYHSNWESGQIMLIGTDGIWETVNNSNEKFGKKRVMEIIRQKQKSSAKDILHAIIDRLANFRQYNTPQDDITLVVIKFAD